MQVRSRIVRFDRNIRETFRRTKLANYETADEERESNNAIYRLLGSPPVIARFRPLLSLTLSLVRIRVSRNSPFDRHIRHPGTVRTYKRIRRFVLLLARLATWCARVDEPVISSWHTSMRKYDREQSSMPVKRKSRVSGRSPGHGFSSVGRNSVNFIELFETVLAGREMLR